ncbi:MAG: hypothetical protein ABSF52_22730 [Syntrophobacteraceae bacterium]|jgi:hypothetical protein
MKSGDKFAEVQNDIGKIADELYHKNVLVDKYLNNSNFSFWISVFALAYAVIISSVQIYIIRPSKVQTLIKTAVETAMFERDKSERRKESVAQSNSD